MAGFTNITIEDYSEKAFVVKGDTKEYKDSLRELGGKYNSNLRDGAGWIFPKTKKSAVEAWKNSGKHLPRTDAPIPVSSVTYTPQSLPVQVDQNDVLNEILKEMKKLSSRLERVEQILATRNQTKSYADEEDISDGDTPRNFVHKRLLK